MEDAGQPATRAPEDRPRFDWDEGPARPRPPRPRRLAARIFAFIGAVVLWLSIAFLLVLVTGEILTKDYYLSEGLWEAAARRFDAASAVVIGVFLIVSMGLIAKRVGYRFRDGLMVFIPIYSYVFMVKMLWRWSSLPERPWDDRGRDRIDGPDPGEPTEVESRASRRPIMIGGLGIMALAVWIVLFSIQPWAPEQGGWRTTEANGVSLSLPSSFAVFTDPDEIAQVVMEGTDPSAREVAEIIQQFPDFFVLLASEFSEEGTETGSLVLVLRLPSFGVPFDEMISSYEEDFEGYELASPVSRQAVDVGVSGLRAVRFDYDHRLPGFPGEVHSADFVVDGGMQVWLLQTINPADRWEEHTSRLDRIVASLAFT
ncbi:MAG TPA: hypothetical protein VF058_08895 [Actinomycetota bacterium]